MLASFDILSTRNWKFQLQRLKTFSSSWTYPRASGHTQRNPFQNLQKIYKNLGRLGLGGAIKPNLLAVVFHWLEPPPPEEEP